MASSKVENLRLALSSIRGQSLRAFLTMLIIALGITALVGILTSIDVLKGSLNSNFSRMGANTFTIRNRETRIRVGNRGKKPKKFRTITYQEATSFSDRFDFPATVSVSTMASFNATVKYGSIKSDPNIQVIGSDQNYLACSGYEISDGRNFTSSEIISGDHVAIIGKDIVTKFFPSEDPIGKEISIGAGKYRVIATLASKGNAMGFGGDKMTLLPIENVRQYFSRPDMTFTINVLARDGKWLDNTISEATGLFRIIRKVQPDEPNNFEIVKSDNFAAKLIDNLRYVSLGATIIGLITLLGAAIGLMNIMLVSVTERTREIGIRKALGATRKVIRNQFLTEAIMICQLGGIMGILLALGLIGGGAIIFGYKFVTPWAWIILGLVTCFIVGLVSGLYPAIKASKLDPIEALRYE
ncbi:MAG TPA: ABC transporter permease [Bacteroidia bacterium]|jgi:putative ABC transport system permease protein|nr:ABC transporter permease [Bacteroidia bacterium]